MASTEYEPDPEPKIQIHFRIFIGHGKEQIIDASD